MAEESVPPGRKRGRRKPYESIEADGRPGDRLLWPPPEGPAIEEDLPPSASLYDRPQPPRRPGRGRWIGLPVLVAVAAAVVGYVVAGGVFGPGQAPGRPAAPDRISDEKAGLVYSVPQGWRPAGAGVLRPFTTSVVAPGDTAALLVGPWKDRLRVPAPTSKAELKDATRDLAESLGNHIFAGRASPKWWHSGEETVAGRPAYSAAYQLTFAKAGSRPAYLRVTTVLLSGGEAAVVFGFAQPDGRDGRTAIAEAIEGAEIL